MLKIDETRLYHDLEALAQIGATPEGGVSRPAMSEADAQGRVWFKHRVREDGFEFRHDGAGNLSAVLPSASSNARTLLVGSHLDSVPNGGRYDGPLGVLSALEALRTIRDANLQLPVHLEAISFTDEEGSLVGLFGSQALTGALTPEHFKNPRGGDALLAEGMRRLNITQESALSAKRDPAELLAFLELHIEQGTRLEDAENHIGVVTAIVGIRSFELHFFGQAAHAGTMPLDKRADALWGAAAFIQRSRELVVTRFAPGVINCGNIEVQPGAYNIVPSESRLALEFRHSSESRLDDMQTALLSLANGIAGQYRLGLEVIPGNDCLAAPMDERVIEAIEAAADKLQLKHARLVSFAGHDTQVLSTITPSAMLFVPSVKGISHNPKEFTKPEDVANGANTVLHTILELVERLS